MAICVSLTNALVLLHAWETLLLSMDRDEGEVRNKNAVILLLLDSSARCWTPPLTEITGEQGQTVPPQTDPQLDVHTAWEFCILMLSYYWLFLHRYY